MAVLCGVVAAAIQAVRLIPDPYKSMATAALGIANVASILVIVTAISTLLVVLAAKGRSGDAEPGDEEPLLPAARVPGVKQEFPIIAFVGLEAQAGSSTLAFNLAVLLAVEGSIGTSKRPRVLCLLSDGPLARRLSLTAELLQRHLEHRSGRIGPDVVDIAIRHPSGCELLGLPRSLVGRHQLRLLGHAVREHFDAVILDCSVGDSRACDGALDVADIVVGVGMATDTSEAAAIRFAGAALARRRWPASGIVVNKVALGQRWNLLESMEFEEVGPGRRRSRRMDRPIVILRDAVVERTDAEALPWSLLPDSRAAIELRRLAPRLLPALFGEDVDVRVG